MERTELRTLAENRYWREADARRAVGAWRRSGLPLEAFAEAHGLGAARLARWHARLGDETHAAPQTVTLAPVRIVDRTRPLPSGPAVEVVLRGGRRLRVEPGFDEETLARVVRVLEGLPC